MRMVMYRNFAQQAQQTDTRAINAPGIGAAINQ